MNKVFKILGIILAIIIAVMGILAVAAKMFITPERVREAVLPIAESSLQRDVSLGDIEISFFSGIVLKDLVILEPDGKETFVAADQVLLRYQLWPLLFKRVLVDEVGFVAPRIRVVRLADKSFNFSDLMGEKEKVDSVRKDRETAGEGIDLLISKVSISKGSLEFLDQHISPKKPFQTTIESLALQAKSIALDRPFPFSLDTKVNGASLSLRGDIDLQAPGVKATIKGQGFDLAAITPYLKTKIPGKLGKALVSVDISFDGRKEKLASKGNLNVQELDLELNALSNAPLRNAALGLDYDITYDPGAEILEITKGDVRFNKIPLQVFGKVQQLTTKPQLSLNVATNQLDLTDVQASLPANLAAIGDLNPAGKVTLRFELQGIMDDVQKLLHSAKIELANVEVTAGGVRPLVSGDLTVKDGTLAAKGLSVNIGENSSLVALTAKNLHGKPILLTHTVISERFVLDPFLPQAEKPKKAETESPKSSEKRPKKEEPGPLSLPLVADGTVKIKQVLYKNMVIDNFDLHYGLEKNILTIDRMTGSMAGGSFSKTATIDLGEKGFVYSGDVHVKKMSAEQFITAFVPKLQGTAFGTGDFDLSFSGKGALPEKLKKNFTGNGTVSITDGKLTGAGLVQGLAAFLDLEQLRVLRFSSFKGDLAVKNGKINIKGDVSGSDVHMTPRGTIGLDGDMDLSLDTRLSPELSAKVGSGGKITRFLTDSKGWTQVPLKVSGTAAAPQFVLDTALINQKIEQKATQTIQQKLEETLFKKSKQKTLLPTEQPGKAETAPKQQETPAPSEPTQDDPAKKLLEDALKDFFRR